MSGSRSLLDVSVDRLSRAGGDVPVLGRCEPSVADNPGHIQARPGFFPKRWEERKVPVPVRLANIIKGHPQMNESAFMFPSPTGKREQNMLLRCKAVAERAGLDPAKFDLKTFRSTYATRMLRKGFDVRTVQDWMGQSR